jgi:predicted permease
MKALSTLRCWLRALAFRSRTREEVTEEFQFCLEAYARDLVQQGLSPQDAARRARLELGRPEQQAERHRSAIGLDLLDELGGDLRFGLRSLWRQPSFSIVTVLSLALGIGATTAMFSLIYSVLLHPFPYTDAERIVNPIVIDQQHRDEVRWFSMTEQQSRVFRKANAIESVVGFTPAQMEITGSAVPGNAFAIYLTENAQAFFGVLPLLGRGIEPADAQSHQPVAVLNYRFWQSHYGGDPTVLGRILQLDDRDYTVVGVMPRTFAFNDSFGTADLYLPRNLLDAGDNPVSSGAWVPWIRLKKNVTMAMADQELDALVHQFAREFPQHYPQQFRVQLQPISAPFRQNTGRTLSLLFTAVLLLLFIGCANCSILSLARGTARHQELSLRTALGASRWRIARQLLVESVVISFAGTALGVAASYWLAELPMKLSPNSFPTESYIRINLPILLFSVALALACGLIFGLMPALRLSHPDLNSTIRSRQRSIAGGGGRRYSLLISGQIAITLLLMATAGTTIAAFRRVVQLPLGYDPHGVMEAGIEMHWTRPSQWNAIQSRPERAAFVELIRRKIEATPGVLSASIDIDVYPPNAGPQQPVAVLDHNAEQQQPVRTFLVSQQFFQTLRIPVRQGRVWTDAENLRGDGVAVVNEEFARRYWPHGVPVGQQLRLPGLVSHAPLLAASPQSDGWRTIVGVAGDVPNNGLGEPVLPAVYLPYTTLFPPYAQFHIRTVGKPLTYLRAVRSAVASVSAEQQIANGAYDLEEGLADDPQWSRQRLFSTLFGVFSAMALLLSLAGIFSVVSWSVAKRTSEFGVRLALGASRAHILWVAVESAAASLATGALAGCAADLIIAQWLNGWMNTRVPGLLSLPLALTFLGASAALACLLAARRAAWTSPTEALRCE